MKSASNVLVGCEGDECIFSSEIAHSENSVIGFIEKFPIVKMTARFVRYSDPVSNNSPLWWLGHRWPSHFKTPKEPTSLSV
jgi:hypothetical protein